MPCGYCLTSHPSKSVVRDIMIAVPSLSGRHGESVSLGHSLQSPVSVEVHMSKHERIDNETQ